MITNRSIDIYNKAIKEIPAYQKFLEENNTEARSIVSVDDYKLIPVTSKNNYLNKFDKNELMWEKEKSSPLMLSSTSGSTGEPYYFPRNEQLSIQYSYIIEDYLRYTDNPAGNTLAIIGFGMGVWIGGTITVTAFEDAAKRMNSGVSILPVGYNKTEIFKALRKLGPQFDQVILVAYPPFAKEIVDEAKGEGLNLKDLNIRLLFAAEAFTETFRKYICNKAGIKNEHLGTLNIYGTADIGAMAYETPLSIMIRKLALEDPLLYKDLFGQIEKTPTLAQYNPDFIEFEQVDNQLLLTGDAAIPLIRYAVGDNGGVLELQKIKSLFSHYGISLEQELESAGIKHTVKNLPFVYVYERVDFSTSLHGINIYPEFIKESLIKPKLSKYFTEKFTMSTKYNIHHDQFLKIEIELQKNVQATPELEILALKSIRSTLIKKSSEFSEISKSKSSSELIRVELWPNGHERYFKPGVKQKWVNNTDI